MIRVFRPASADEHQAFLKSHCDRCLLRQGKPCEILEAVVVNEEIDPGYPIEWIRDDGVPTCTAFLPVETLAATDMVAPVDAMAPIAAEPEAPVRVAASALAEDVGSDIGFDAVEVTTIGRATLEVGRLRGRRIWSMPYAAVAELFDTPDTLALREALKVPAPTKAKARRAKAHVTITVRSRQDGASVSSQVKLHIRRSA